MIKKRNGRGFIIVGMRYYSRELLFQEEWTEFKAKYNINYCVAIDYLFNEILIYGKKKCSSVTQTIFVTLEL